MTFIAQHAEEPITVQAIADATGVRPRRLQQLFQDECGTTPMAHLRAVRAAAADRAERNPADENGVER
jgi:transcriptional regulator GlxA family with amidase domain